MPDPAAQHPATPPLSAEDLCFAFEPGQWVLQGLTAALRPGAVTALIGPNAAGKTTLFRLMLGHLQPTHGRVSLEGRPLDRLSPAQRAARLSYVPQRGGASFAFTVRQMVRMGRHVLGPDPRAVEQALADCDLADLADRVYAHLSVGQQQRVLLARALAQAHGPHGRRGAAMLLDEPVSAMDPLHVHHTMRLLRQQAARGLAVLIVLHDLNLAARYADDVWVLSHGRLVSAGPWAAALDPNLLEDVYGVRFDRLTPHDHDRPLFYVRPENTLSGRQDHVLPI
ncbi:MAG: ATP-binding cassette domain-containing protein [Phycisphaeraceae bacterium]|nr:ATP-binding cassette domain-containing protein [Phycisphaeraceae bacterium]